MGMRPTLRGLPHSGTAVSDLKYSLLDRIDYAFKLQYTFNYALNYSPKALHGASSMIRENDPSGNGGAIFSASATVCPAVADFVAS